MRNLGRALEGLPPSMGLRFVVSFTTFVFELFCKGLLCSKDARVMSRRPVRAWSCEFGCEAELTRMKLRRDGHL